MTTELVELAERPEFTVDEALRIADQNADSYEKVASVSRTLAAEVRRLRALASRAGGADEVSAWRELYQLQTAMRYMDNRIGKRAAYRMAEEDVRRMTAQLAETAKPAAPEPVGVG